MRKLMLSSVLAIICMILTPLFSIAQNTELTQARLLGKTKAVKDLPLANTALYANKTKGKLKAQFKIPNFQGNKPMPTPFKNLAQPKNGDPLYLLPRQKDLLSTIEPNLVFDGMDQLDSNTFPPDTNGDVNEDYYVQTINSSQGAIMAVWDKEGQVVQAPISLNSLWAEFNVTGLGDPIILWDKEAQRWFVSELAIFGTDIMLIAISDTDDPTGTWTAYEIQSPELPDYPKYGIWNDSYFITTNEISSTYIPIYAIDRTAMLNGADNANVVRLEGMTKFSPEGGTQIFQVATPVNQVGNTPPPADAPHYTARIHDDAWDGELDAIEIWETNVDWSNPEAASLQGPTIIPISSFDSELCDQSIFSCVEQSDGTTISVLQQVLMYRVNYRNMGSHESIVLNFSVDVDGTNHAGVRWVELRKQADSDWTLYQEGTIAPDENHRFMGSINMDAAGNILLAYSVVGPSAELDLRYTGRYNGDPLGEMTIDEFEFADGQGISDGGGRWGDYSSMSIDPSNDLTFWFTGEYYGSTIYKTSVMSTLLRKDTFDIGIQAVAAPVNSGYLTDQENITIAVHNHGYEPAYDFNLSYSMNGGMVTTEFYTDTIQPDSTKLHTFSTTEDLSVIGDYDFIAYSAWVRDTAFFNDTLKTVVSQLPRNDAEPVGLEGVGEISCLDFFDGGIILRNAGVDTLTSVTIEYQINDNDPIIINWVGQLESGGIELIPVSSSEVIDGINTITVTTTMPNGIVDERPENNSISGEFTLLIESSVELEFYLLTDDYPQETSWRLSDSDGNILFESEGGLSPQTEYLTTWCLAEGCYLFELFDTFGDGLQYQGVSGDAQIRRLSDDIILFNLGDPNFGFSIEAETCTDFQCSVSAKADASNVSEPGASDGVVIVTSSNGTAPLEYSIDNGENWQNNAIFNNLVADTYIVTIRDASNCESTVEIEVGTCTLMISAETAAASTNGTEDGAIMITATNGGDGVEYSLDGNNFFEGSTFENIGSGLYTIYVRNSDGCLQTLDVEVDAVVGTQTVPYGVSVKVSPNPTEGLFLVEVKGLNDLSTLYVDIFDANGRILKTDRLVNYSGVLKNRLSLTTFPSGLYYLRLKSDRIDHVLKIVKK